METKIIRVNPNRPDPKKIRVAAEIIKGGGLVVFPTETVYGIGANAFDAVACKRIFSVKGRKSDNPLIVHVSDIRMAGEIAYLPKRYANIMKKVWPGPITFIVKARSSVPKVVTAGLDTVAIRIPSHKVALELIRASGLPIAAPSANISERPSATKGRHAFDYFKGKVGLILDSGSSRHGLESTVVDLRNFRLLRPGAFTVSEIEKAFGKKVKLVKGNSRKPVSPGMKYRHYSPRTRLVVFKGRISDLKRIKSSNGIAFIGSDEACKKLAGTFRKRIGLGSEAELSEIGRNLFDALIRVDRLKVRLAVIQEFPEDGIGLAIMNRIKKAAQGEMVSGVDGLERLIRL